MLRNLILFLLNNILVNQFLILIKKDEFIKQFKNNWKRYKLNPKKSLQENVGFSHNPKVQGAIEHLHEKIQSTVQNSHPNGGAVLDIGCGTGLYLQDFNPKVWRCYGLDLNESFVNAAQALLPDAQIKCGLIDDLKEKLKFDVILNTSVLEYIVPSKLNIFLEQIITRLNREGLAIIQYPHALRYKDLWYPDLSYVRYSPNYLEKVIKKNFQDIEILEHHQFLNQRTIFKYDKEPLDFEMENSFRNGCLLILQKK